MKFILAVVLALIVVPLAAAQYPKTITLTVTRIERNQKPFASCDNCTTVMTVEAHSNTTNYVLICESSLIVDHPENDSTCARFETGVYQARRLSPEALTFWPDDISAENGKRRVLFSVVVEEMRPRLEGPKGQH